MTISRSLFIWFWCIWFRHYEL